MQVVNSRMEMRELNIYFYTKFKIKYSSFENPNITFQRHSNSCFVFYRFISSFNRPNLRYTVYQKKPKSSKNQILSLINETFKDECGIVYCISRNETDELALFLSENGVEALSYHAGLADAVRIHRQKQWIAEKVHLP